MVPAAWELELCDCLVGIVPDLTAATSARLTSMFERQAAARRRAAEVEREESLDAS